MSSTPQGSSRRLPEHPDLRHLKDQAKDLLRAGQAASLADAQGCYVLTGQCVELGGEGLPLAPAMTGCGGRCSLSGTR